jgi:hypothetical protein
MALNSTGLTGFEVGPIRPPSEAYSLLIRVTRNCPWNKCQFCQLYKGQKFEVRSVEDVKEDIQIAKGICDQINDLALKSGGTGNAREKAAAVFHHYQDNPRVRDVALWMLAGGSTAFLQDANTLILKTPGLVEILTFLKRTFPQIARVTSYGRSETAARKSVEELKELKDAGLSRLHIGLESGSNEVLEFMKKGVTGEEHVEGGKRVKGAGISLSEYIMPGLGGRKMSLKHMRETASVLNQINPDFIRIRTLQVSSNMPLWAKVESGEFELQAEDEIVEELGDLIESLDITSEIKSDHIMNLLPDVEGKFPEAKQACLEVIRRYLSLPAGEKLNYRLGRRAGYYERLDDMSDTVRRAKVDEIADDVSKNDQGNVELLIQRLRSGII